MLSQEARLPEIKASPLREVAQSDGGGSHTDAPSYPDRIIEKETVIHDSLFYFQHFLINLMKNSTEW